MSEFDKEIDKNIKYEEIKPKTSTKSRLVTFLLCYIFGMFGAHRFYVGKNGTAVLYILTMGLFGVGMLIDTLMIILGKFKDVEDNLITKWITED